jgi:hypothetical protein
MRHSLPRIRTPFQQSRVFRRNRKRWRLRQQRCLEVTSRPAMSVWSMRGVGLIDITVGNACVSAHRDVPPRDAARRTTSLRNSRAAGDIPAALVRLARTVCLKRLWLRFAFEVDAAPSAKFMTPIVIPPNSRTGPLLELAPCYGCDHRNCPGVMPRI